VSVYVCVRERECVCVIADFTKHVLRHSLFSVCMCACVCACECICACV